VSFRSVQSDPLYSLRILHSYQDVSKVNEEGVSGLRCVLVSTEGDTVEAWNVTENH
jgi:hypothetical protein